jgi:uncharacterized protein (TIRG00374 family)
MQAEDSGQAMKLSRTTSRVRASSFWRGWGQPILGVLLSAGVILWLIRNLDFRHMLLALQGVDLLWVGLGLLTVVLTLWARVLRWRALLDCRDISLSDILKALVLGQLVNLVFPGRVGDLGRAHLITQAGYNNWAQALGTVALEKLWDIILLVGVIFILSFWQPLPVWVTMPARLTAAAGGILLATMMALLLLRRFLLPNWVPFSRHIDGASGPCSKLLFRAGQLITHFSDGLAGLQRPGVMLTAGAWSLLVWLFGAWTNLSLLKAFGLPFSMGIALFLLAVLQVGVAVPSLPGRIGVFEGLCLVTLSLFGIEANLALGYGVMLHAVVLLPPMALGLWWLLRLDSASRQAIWKST